MSSGQFGSDEEDPTTFAPKRGLKLPTSPSAPISKKESAVRFNETVDSIERNKRDMQGTLGVLGSKILTLLNDKTLDANKNSLIKDNERMALKELVTLVKHMDADEAEDLNAGIMTLATLLLTGVIKQRDRINQLEFELSQLTKIVAGSSSGEKK